jgi:hypothetical protein
MNSPTLIKCGDGCFAPSVATCVHIIEGTAKTVLPVRCEKGGEVEYDWYCPQCFDKYYLHNEDTFDVKDMRIVCIHCLRKIMRPYRKQMRRRLRSTNR